jgi:hypothetical protein
MVEKVTEEIAGRKTKSMLEEGGEQHNFFSVGCREEVILNKIEDLALVRSELLEHVWVGGAHGKGKENLGREIEAPEDKCVQGRRKWWWRRV